MCEDKRGKVIGGGARDILSVSMVLMTTALLSAVGCRVLSTQATPREEAERSRTAHPTREQTEAERRLAAYLIQGLPTPGERETILDIMQKAQVIRVYYEKTVPEESEKEEIAFACSLKASGVMPRTSHSEGKTGVQIEAVFSKFFWNETDVVDTDQWPDEMRRPIQAGYEAKSVKIVLTPDQVTKKRSFVASQAVARALASKLETLRTDFVQLRSFDAAALHLGQWSDGQRPEYPSLDYVYKLIPSGGKGREKTGEDWCEVRLFFSPITGNPSQVSLPTREYPLQGLLVRYAVASADSEFDEQVRTSIRELLTRLDDLECELGGISQTGASDRPE